MAAQSSPSCRPAAFSHFCLHYFQPPAPLMPALLPLLQVLDRFNAALESLFESESLPDDPLPFLMERMRGPLLR